MILSKVRMQSFFFPLLRLEGPYLVVHTQQTYMFWYLQNFSFLIFAFPWLHLAFLALFFLNLPLSYLQHLYDVLSQKDTTVIIRTQKIQQQGTIQPLISSIRGFLYKLKLNNFTRRHVKFIQPLFLQQVELNKRTTYDKQNPMTHIDTSGWKTSYFLKLSLPAIVVIWLTYLIHSF